MSNGRIPSGSSTQDPWSPDPASAIERLGKLAPFDAMLLGLFRVDRPRADEIIVADKIDTTGLRRWVEGGCTQDRVFQAALQQGWAQGTSIEAGLERAGRKAKSALNILWVASPESLADRRWWCAAFLRSGDPFSAAQRETLELAVKQWQARFNRPQESGLSQMLAGSDNRLIHADPFCLQKMISGGVAPHAMLTELTAVREQRWPEMSGDEVHDASLMVAGEPTWVCFRRGSAVDLPDAEHWMVELRPMEEEELPTVGSVEDERVAQALAYIHDRYDETPTLNELADWVQVSPFHFHRVFSKLVGVSPKQYQLMRQLQVAKWRLRCGRDAIGDIAKEVGFANHAHFTSTFRRMMGISPTQYQQRFAGVPKPSAD